MLIQLTHAKFYLNLFKIIDKLIEISYIISGRSL